MTTLEWGVAALHKWQITGAISLAYFLINHIGAGSSKECLAGIILNMLWTLSVVSGTGCRRQTAAPASVPTAGGLQRTRRPKAIASCVAHAGWRRMLAGCADRRWRQSAPHSAVMNTSRVWRVDCEMCRVKLYVWRTLDSLTAALSSVMSRWTLRSPAIITCDVPSAVCSSRFASSSKNRSVARDNPGW